MMSAPYTLLSGTLALLVCVFFVLFTHYEMDAPLEIVLAVGYFSLAFFPFELFSESKELERQEQVAKRRMVLPTQFASITTPYSSTSVHDSRLLSLRDSLLGRKAILIRRESQPHNAAEKLVLPLRPTSAPPSLPGYAVPPTSIDSSAPIPQEIVMKEKISTPSKVTPRLSHPLTRTSGTRVLKLSARISPQSLHRRKSSIFDFPDSFVSILSSEQIQNETSKATYLKLCKLLRLIGVSDPSASQLHQIASALGSCPDVDWYGFLYHQTLQDTMQDMQNKGVLLAGYNLSVYDAKKVLMNHRSRQQCEQSREYADERTKQSELPFPLSELGLQRFEDLLSHLHNVTLDHGSPVALGAVSILDREVLDDGQDHVKFQTAGTDRVICKANLSPRDVSLRQPWHLVSESSISWDLVLIDTSAYRLPVEYHTTYLGYIKIMKEASIVREALRESLPLEGEELRKKLKQADRSILTIIARYGGFFDMSDEACAVRMCTPGSSGSVRYAEDLIPFEHGHRRTKDEKEYWDSLFLEGKAFWDQIDGYEGEYDSQGFLGDSPAFEWRMRMQAGAETEEDVRKMTLCAPPSEKLPRPGPLATAKQGNVSSGDKGRKESETGISPGAELSPILRSAFDNL